jgi:hypothetical protein
MVLQGMELRELTLLQWLSSADHLDARVREQLRATVLFVLIAQLLASEDGELRPAARGGFGPATSWRAPRRAKPPWRGSLTGRRPRG